jgi:hypothetical protein
VRLGLVVEVGELGVPVGMLAALDGFGVAPQAEWRCQMVCVKPEPDFRSITDSWLLNWDIRWA